MRHLRPLVVLLALLLGASCTSDPPEPVRVGAIYPLSGTQGMGGVDEYHGVRVAAELVNAEGGVGGRPVVIDQVDVPEADAAPGAIKALADRALAELSDVFDRMYAEDGRPSIPPERLLKASLLIALYSVRSERAFCEELEYNLLFRWFLDMDPIEPSFDPTVFTKNRERLLKHEVGQELFDEVIGRAHERGLLSDEHFTVDGTLIEAAAGLKSFRPKQEPSLAEAPDDPGNPTVDFRG